MAGVGIGFFIVLTVSFFLVQVTIFRSLPVTLKKWMVVSPLIGLVANFVFSNVILFFTGVGAIAGIINLVSSIFVGLYLYGYAGFHKITKIEIRKWKGLVPYPYVVQENPTRHWLF